MWSYYVLKRIGPGKVLVSFFNGGKEFENQYIVANGQCSCPGWKKSATTTHKHFQLVEEWTRAGEPWFACFELELTGSVKKFTDFCCEKI